MTLDTASLKILRRRVTVKGWLKAPQKRSLAMILQLFRMLR